MKSKTQVMDSSALSRALARISHEILERNDGVEGLMILGIKTRGVPIAKILCDNIEKFEGRRVPLGEIDVTYQRDDYSDEEKKSRATASDIPCSVENKTVVLVDDVLYTGRTAKAGIEELFKYGRPKAVQFCVLVDRGHRELPIRPDYVGKNVPTSKSETVSVRLFETDGDSGVYICEK